LLALKATFSFPRKGIQIGLVHRLTFNQGTCCRVSR